MVSIFFALAYIGFTLGFTNAEDLRAGYALAAFVAFPAACILLVLARSVEHPRFWLRWIGWTLGYIVAQILSFEIFALMFICRPAEWCAEFFREIFPLSIVSICLYGFCVPFILLIRFCPFYRERFRGKNNI